MEELAKYARQAPEEMDEEDVQKLADTVLHQRNQIKRLKRRLEEKKREYSREKGRRWRSHYSPS